LYNEFVKLYCDHYGLEVKVVNHMNWVFENNCKIGYFSDNEKIITFTNGTVVKKGDLALSIIEGTNLHSQEV